MIDTSAADSSITTAAEEAGEDAAEAFALLGNETRLAILLALWEAHDPYTDTAAVPFSELRERVGIEDSGQFNYHLKKLEGVFVSRTDEGYALRSTGLRLVQTVIAGTGRDATLAPTDAGIDCHLCGASTEVSYDDGWLYHRCTECSGGFGDVVGNPSGVLFAEPFPPAALAGRTPQQVFAAGVFSLLQAVATKAGGLCPACSGAIETTVAVCEDHDPDGGLCPTCGNPAQLRVRWVCPVCKYHGGVSPAGMVIARPEVVAFYHDHGLDVADSATDPDAARRLLTALRGHEQELLSTEPLRVAVTVRSGDDSLRLTLDERMQVIGTDRR